MQALALARSDEPGLRQVLSLVISCLSVANTFMCVAHDLDMNKHFRVFEALDYGFIPSGPRGNLVCVALFVFGPQSCAAAWCWRRGTWAEPR